LIAVRSAEEWNRGIDLQHLDDKASRSAGISYLKYVLTQGHTLAKFLLQSVTSQDGRVSILSPDPLDSSQLLEFEYGHFPQEPVSATIGGSPGTMSPIADSDDEFAVLISELLDSPDSVCLMENSSFRVGDAWLQRAKSCLVTYEREVFHVVFNADHTDDKIDDAIREARRIPIFIGAVGRLTSKASETIQREKVITANQLEDIAETARLIFVGAYDGEGLVLWMRQTL
jgi:hypothetical protein